MADVGVVSVGRTQLAPKVFSIARNLSRNDKRFWCSLVVNSAEGQRHDDSSENLTEGVKNDTVVG